jgi:hypothetical protein
VLAEGYTGAHGTGAPASGPTAEDFWGGEAVGVVDSPREPAAADRGPGNSAAGNGNPD